VQTRAYSICRRCAAVYPEGRRCPACDGDEIAARAIAAATAHAIEQAPAPMRRRSSAALAAAGLFALILALGATVAAIAAPGGDAAPAAPGSASGGSAAQVH